MQNLTTQQLQTLKTQLLNSLCTTSTITDKLLTNENNELQHQLLSQIHTLLNIADNLLFQYTPNNIQYKNNKL